MNQRRVDIDCLKGVAIIAVCLYHMGFLDSGYLGVDIFFVINGYFILPRLWESVKKEEFQYFPFVFSKYIRFTPIILLIVAFSLLLGVFFLLPNQIKVLSESSVASSLFLQNEFAAISSGNYWDIQASYSPLMHFWYIGVVFQFYLTIPLILLLLHCITKHCEHQEDKIFLIFLLAIAAVSLSLNFLDINESRKFYSLPFRLYEFCFGGIIVPATRKINSSQCCNKVTIVIPYVILSALLLILCSCFIFHKDIDATAALEAGFDTLGQANLIPREILTLSTVLCTFMVVLSGFKLPIIDAPLAFIGKMSFSIYCWHQFILAYIRSIYSNELDYVVSILFFIISFVLSLLTYRFIEKKVICNIRTLSFCIVISVVLILCSLYVYSHNGVLKDYPEMDITVENAHGRMYSEYCDRVRQYDVDFPNNEKRNLLIIGNSFARDFANVILESSYKDSVNISYCPNLSQLNQPRFEEADVICYHGFKHDILTYKPNPKTKLYGIGTKNYGESISGIYSRRFRDDYYETTIPVIHTILAQEKRLKESWGENYISFLEPIMKENQVTVFTDDNKFISFDCRHLAKAGAQYYSKHLDLRKILIK